MEKNDEWETVEVSQNEDKVEYEIEKEEVEAKAEPDPAPESDEPQELDGIETKGAQKGFVS